MKKTLLVLSAAVALAVALALSAATCDSPPPATPADAGAEVAVAAAPEPPPPDRRHFVTPHATRSPGPRKLGAAQAQPPAYQASWRQRSWVIDPANASGCASDTNKTCGVAACPGADGGLPGDGPCRTYAQVAQRWGTYEPRLRNDVTITFASSQPDDTDPVVLRPYIEHGTHLLVQGALGAVQRVASGVLGAVTPKNRATGQVLRADLGSGLVAEGQLLVNATHPSRAWVDDLVSGTTFTVTQPLVAAVPFVDATGTPVEVDSWAPGDAWTAYEPVVVDLAYVQASWEDTDVVDFDNVVFVYQLRAFAPGRSDIGIDVMTIGPNVAIFESKIDIGQLSIEHTSLFQWIFGNDFIASDTVCFQSTPPESFNPSNAQLPLIQFWAGAIDGNLEVNSAVLDYDIVVGGGASNGAGVRNALLGLVYVQPFTRLVVSGSSQVSTGGIVWGGGLLDEQGVSRLIYPAGRGAAAFLTSNFNLNSKTAACATTSAVDAGATTTVLCNIPLTGANLDNAVGPAGFGGTAFLPGGASITSGPP